MDPRFPFDPAPADELRREADAMAAFAAVSPFPAPTPVGIGDPTERYASAWSLQTWIDGAPADHDASAGSQTLVDDVVRLIAALRRAPVGARSFDGRGRGGDLRDHDEWMSECFARSGGLIDVGRARALWQRLRELGSPDALSMSHRDLTPPNLLVERGRLTGVLDSGSFGPADRALDLVAAWHLFDATGRARLRSELGIGDGEWLRGAAWAFQQAMGLGWYYVDSNPTMSALGCRPRADCSRPRSWADAGSVARREPAVGVQELPGDPPALRRDQERHEGGDVGRRPDAPERMRGHERLREPLRHPSRVDRTGVEHVRGDAEGAELAGRRDDEAVECALG